MSLNLIPKIKEKQRPRELGMDFGYLKDKKHLETLKGASVFMFGKNGILTSCTPKLIETISMDSALSNSIDLEDGPFILRSAVLASDGEAERAGDIFEIRGRALERAILEEGLEIGLVGARQNSERHKLLERLKFQGNFLGALYEELSWPNRIYFSGNPEILLREADFVYRKGQKTVKSSLWQEILEKTLQDKMRQGHSVVAVSYRDVAWKNLPPQDNFLTDTVFLGFLVFKNSLRQDVVASLSGLKANGKKVLLISGENAFASHKLLQDAGLAEPGVQMLTGDDFQYLSDRDLFGALNRQTVFGRLQGSHKMRISQVLQDRGEVVAYIGSETNDLEPILSSNVGMALDSGEETAKQVADIVVLDNLLADLLKI
jgi:Ca2+-transporting ATPase